MYSDNSVIVHMSIDILSLYLKRQFSKTVRHFVFMSFFVNRTASVGYGTAPVEAISTTVIIIIAAGLGIPVVIIIFGGIYVCIRKRRNGYQKIDDGLTNSYPNLN